MLRGAPTPPAPSPRSAQSVRSQRRSGSHFSPGVDPSGRPNISEVEKSRIYDAWIAAGKPHNLVCSQCRNPDNLLPCETCCRSYHAACLNIVNLQGQFYCPSCKRNQWDQSPPQFDGSASSSQVSPNSTASVSSPATGGSPSRFMGSSRERLPLPLGSAIQSPAGRGPSDMESRRGDPVASQYDVLARARDFLVEYGHFPPSHEFRLEFLLKLGSMIAEVESHQSMQQELHALREENASLRSSNARLGAMFASNLSAKPGPSSSRPPVLPSPAVDPSETSWDRIVTDLI